MFRARYAETSLEVPLSTRAIYVRCGPRDSLSPAGEQVRTLTFVGQILESMIDKRTDAFAAASRMPSHEDSRFSYWVTVSGIESAHAHRCCVVSHPLTKRS